jgi:16S rRNA (cytosine1402-N4)-methyltransferase
LDVDPQALELAHKRLAPYGQRAILVRASYTTILEQLQRVGRKTVDGILLDLGMSSIQLDTPQRGFSFQVDAPLDMRFDPSNPVKAADLVNSKPENELADILYRFGEERHSHQVAQAIVRARPVTSTRQLAEVVARVTGGRRKGLHPATRTFQALRIAVNHELEAVEDVLPRAVACLVSGGRLAVISFHSLEDRLVKQFMRRDSQDCLCPPRQPVCTCGHRASLREINRHPVRPQEAELRNNPRARSARLRVAEKL